MSGDAHDEYRDWIVDRALARLDQMGTEERDALRLTLDFRGVGDAPGDDASDTEAETGATRQSAARPVIAAAVASTPLAEDVTGELDVADLLAMQLPPVRMLVPGIIAEGTTILAGPPKMGKSVLAYELFAETGLGGDMLGVTVNDGEPADALYCALEDGRRRGQDRFRAVLRDRKLPHGLLRIRWEAPPLGGGFEPFLDEWLDTHPRARLVIIDTLGRMRGEQAGDTRRNAYQVDVRDLGAVQRMVQDRPGLSLVIVHHTNKGRDDDFVARVSGTYGIAGSADTIIVLSRKRAEAVGMLSVTSRELPERDVPVRMDDLSGWTLAPDALPGASAERKLVYEAIREQGPVMPSVIARALGMERTAVAHIVGRMEDDGLVMRAPKGYVATDRVMSSMGKPVPDMTH